MRRIKKKLASHNVIISYTHVYIFKNDILGAVCVRCVIKCVFYSCTCDTSMCVSHFIYKNLNIFFDIYIISQYMCFYLKNQFLRPLLSLFTSLPAWFQKFILFVLYQTQTHFFERDKIRTHIFLKEMKKLFFSL